MTQNTGTAQDEFKAAMARQEAKLNAEIKAIKFVFGEDSLENVDLNNGYNRRSLAEISDSFQRAKAENLVFELSFGPEVTAYLTPNTVIERFETDLPFSNSMHQDGVYTLITPREAIEKVSSILNNDPLPYDKECNEATLMELEAYEKAPFPKQRQSQEMTSDIA